ncbi:endolytic peptidoglycan transglycosylase RlpA [Enterobacteriaceae bacterium 4M9]|nr:endolytic peptidoglycan transglycosylase RlpA [Enterobacteriaceae bacterium 4M9]
MRKQWIGVCVAAGLLAACSSDNDNQQQTSSAPQPAVCNGPVVEITGAEPRYEPQNPIANQDYKRDGKSWKIVRDPSRFSQAGFAAIYDAEPGSNLTAIGEAFDPTQLTAAHPTLPVPSYARITNLANGRMIVVRINDRGPYGNDRVISLSRASADRLNTSNNTKVRIDPIVVAPDGSLSGPGTACTTIARQTYALPSRPDLSSGLGSASSAQAPTPAGNVNAISNDSLTPMVVAPVAAAQTSAAAQMSDASMQASASSVAPVTQAQPAPGEQPVQTTQPQLTSGSVNTPVTAPGSVQGASTGTGYMVQVGAIGDGARASQWQQELSQKFSVPGKVAQNENIYRVQLGPFARRGEAMALQQRLMIEAQLQSFITSAQ